LLFGEAAPVKVMTGGVVVVGVPGMTVVGIKVVVGMTTTVEGIGVLTVDA
jgi:hypothetical protein